MGTRSLRRLSPEAVERNEERTPGVSIVRMRVELSLDYKTSEDHRAAAARALQGEATTRRLKEQLEDASAQHEQIAEEIERASEPGIRSKRGRLL
jgi:hypothetical protein